ncbi:hypothetical protein HGRIS_007024 [Hohenbuehelia grisea]|uniref:Heterokaryon incompatibility domain-containing protein n=1 Tax=Hohenbuehelia grisea TaxID=104357 RepID=A0ABR3JAX5_9AGAR
MLYPRSLEDRQIRVIALHPGPDTDPIIVELLETDLDEAPSFEALSYVWGDVSHRSEITCMDSPFLITQNLRDALQTLRSSSAKRLLWIDAICINQADLDERSQQVKLMRDIFLNAKRVLVWLDLENDENVPAAIALIDNIFALCHQHAQSVGGEVVELAHEKGAFVEISASQLESTTATSEAWDALRLFFGRPWFTRVWCVQEIVVARGSTMMVGQQYTLSWQKVGVAASWLHANSIEADFDVPAEMAEIPFSNAFFMFDVIPEEEDSLTHTLVHFRDFQATDPRDKVFALLGLLNYGVGVDAPLITVNYRRPTWKVFADVVSDSITKTGNLTVLSSIHHDSPFDESTPFPSWVPRWDTSPDSMALLSEYNTTWNACSDEHPLQTFDIDTTAQLLYLKGVEFDTIEWTTDLMSIDSFKDTKSPVSHPVIEAWNKSGLGFEVFRDGPLIDAISMAATLTGGMTSDFSTIYELDMDLRIEFYSDFLAFMWQLFDAFNRHTDGPKLDIGLEREGFGDPHRFRIAASRACDQRKLFTTPKGHFGLCPGCAEAGDVVVVLYGGAMPYVLRPSVDNYWFMGEAYIDMIMVGEAFDTFRSQCSTERVVSIT